MDSLTQRLTQLGTVEIGVLASLFAGFATFIGALPVVFVHRHDRPLESALLGLAAGIMLAATAFSLLLPAFDTVEARGHADLTGVVVVAAGLLIGGGFLCGLHMLVPHKHEYRGVEGGTSPRARARLSSGFLIVLAIAVHNFPEGMAVGIGFGGGDIGNGMAISLGIFLQNLPEGFIAALAMLSGGSSVAVALLAAFATGMIEVMGGAIGAFAVSLGQTILPWALSFAAGAMLFVISHEMIPETHRRGQENYGTAGLMVGFVIMMSLDRLLG